MKYLVNITSDYIENLEAKNYHELKNKIRSFTGDPSFHLVEAFTFNKNKKHLIYKNNNGEIIQAKEI